jgi:hypothetical protein
MRLSRLLRLIGLRSRGGSRHFYRALRDLRRIDGREVQQAVFRTASTSSHDRCLIGLYCRGQENVASLLALEGVRDFRAIARITRSLFELVVEMKLIERIPDAILKIETFSRKERLRCAQRIVAFTDRLPLPTRHRDHYVRFIADHGEAIEAECQSRWPGVESVEHWSGMGLTAALELLDVSLQQVTQVRLSQLSWYTSADGALGLTLGADAFEPFLTGHLQIVTDLYVTLLTAIMAEYSPGEVHSGTLQRVKRVQQRLEMPTAAHLKSLEAGRVKPVPTAAESSAPPLPRTAAEENE